MTLAREAHENNIVLGAGELWLDELDGNLALQGERYLGDTVGATLTVNSERTTIASGDGAVSRDLADVTRSISRVLNITLHDSSLDNWELFVLGIKASRSVAPTRVTGASAWKLANAQQGRSYQIGAGPALPGGVGAVTDTPASNMMLGDHDAGDLSVIVTNDAAAPASANEIARASNYTIDKAAGRIDILPGAPDIANGTDIFIHYQPASAPGSDTAATAAKSVLSADVDQGAKTIRAAVRYIEDPAAGTGRHVFARKCTVVPNGEAALKSRETEQQFQLQCVVLDPPTEPDGTKYPALSIYTA